MPPAMMAKVLTMVPRANIQILLSAI